MAKVSRSLENAFERTPEVEAFIGGADVENKSAKPKKKVSNTESGGAMKTKKPQAKAKQDSRQAKQQLVSFSTRISKEVSDNFGMCMAKRKVDMQSPWTQQEITEQALRDWFTKHNAWSK